ncbi:MAG: hypothetical protein IT163_09060 [Bryobacterales bacterium]|nr:hypothetical protein [Bryobacterales bacterium]
MSGIFPSLDARARLLAVVAATVIVASTPVGELAPFLAYVPLTYLLLRTGQASREYLAWRCFAAAPFLLMAALLLAIEAAWPAGGWPAGSWMDAWKAANWDAGLPRALSIAGKGFTAVLLLAFLMAMTELADLLWALRKLGSPHLLNLILGMMYRYTSLLSEEYARMERARDCRMVRPLGWQGIGVYGHHMGSLLVRSWDRADRVHAAMVSRGFTGEWPVTRVSSFGARETVFVLICAAAFLTARVLM